MIISSQGFGHFTDGINNQDFGIDSPRMLLVLDGCSGAKYSEVGTRLFAQLFSRKENWDSLENFESNVKSTFDDILEMAGKFYKTREELEKDFIMENLLFTIIACFQIKDKYVVKLFGDGYIITKNKHGLISYMKHSYGKCPPYYAYKYSNIEPFMNYEFKEIVFDKSIFPIVAIATDGFMPIARGIVNHIDEHIFNLNEAVIKYNIKRNIQNFEDDITIGIFGGKENEIFGSKE